MSALFYYRLIRKVVLPASRLAKAGGYTRNEWVRSSRLVLDYLERVGVRFDIEGLDNLRLYSQPVVFIGNHMSILETFILPCIIEPVKSCTFIVKEELLAYPVFGHVMRSVEPVAVTRANAKQDLITVMEQGKERLDRGVSLIIFPQTTRTTIFNPMDFNSLGLKLAHRAGVPVIPIALKTDAWGNGKLLKDFGRIDIRKTVHFAFGSPLKASGRRTAEQGEITGFISDRLSDWSRLEAN